MNSRAVLWWYRLLCLAAVLNIVLWSLSAAAVGPHGEAGANPACRLQLFLSAVYVLGCAFRSLLPVYDIPRIVLVDSPLSSVMIGRSVATIAEVCFAAQWALLLHRAAVLGDSPFGEAAAVAIVPLILLAEVCSWHAVLTTAQRGHIFENSIWGLSAVLLLAGLLAIGPRRLIELYPPMIAWWAGGIAYGVFMFGFDVPMYWARWRADQLIGRPYLSISRGAVDVWRRRVVSHRWQDWKTEVLWMSLYFTVGVWSSVSVVYACLAMDAHPR